jgi:DNA-directed RNA polymerase specialized sigma24 family protein
VSIRSVRLTSSATLIRAELDRCYREWRDGENRPVDNELHVAVWKFATTYAGDDLGHDVCLRVVQALNRSQRKRPAALPQNLSAYVYEACRNARIDQKRQAWKYVPLPEQNIPDPFDFVDHENDDERAPSQWLATFERCRKSLPAAIAEVLNLDDFDPSPALGTMSSDSDARKKQIQRATNKCLLAVGAAALIGYPTPQPLSSVISRLSPSLRGGQWERILAIALQFRGLDGVRHSARTLVEAAEQRLSTFVRDPGGIAAFKDSYTWLRTAALVSPEVAEDGYAELKSSFYRYTGHSPLTGRLLDRIHALTGNEAAALEGNRFWHQCLAVLKGEADRPSESEAFFGAVYVITYYAQPRLSRRLLSLLHPFDRTQIEQVLKDYADELRDRVIAEACANVAEGMYKGGPHAEANYVRVQLALSCLSKYNRRFGNGYARLAPEAAMKLAIVAEHTSRTTNDRQLRQMSGKIRGFLMHTYDLKWRAFSRLINWQNSRPRDCR